MKRIVQCPKCESKLAVFDLGKPINQKCPKCGNAFVVDSEQNKTAPAAASMTSVPAAVPATSAPAPAAPPTPVAPPSTPAPVATSSAPSVVETAPPSSAPVAATPAAASLPSSATSLPAATPQSAPSSKEIELKKPTPRPTASKPVNDVPSAAHEPIAHQGGVSFLHVMVIIGLLILTIILQVMGKKAAEKHYADLATRLNRVEAKIQSQK